MKRKREGKGREREGREEEEAILPNFPLLIKVFTSRFDESV